MALHSFHVSVHARPPGCAAGPMCTVDGRELATLEVPADLATTSALEPSFEQLAARLADFERMYVEPDGSFVWVSADARHPWQIDGMIYDRAGRVQFVELKGSCPAAALDRLLAALGWPWAKIVFQLIEWSLWLGEAEFRRYAGM